ncbi:C39 family peptidase [Apilactobacillus ozensis]|uniref:C39 family peptidase n=1 Tax=Apilactobacillus ozensis TaxID=866801 RepID=UPI00200B9DA4|nr:C39 family peptidase [Apilactobacillus ozensis]MCK8606828.1 C39 family peptidase [Apilactobacillus ozensis]
MKKTILTLGIAAMLSSTAFPFMNSQALTASANSVVNVSDSNLKYDIKSARNLNSIKVKSGNWQLFNQPYSSLAYSLGNTKDISGKLVQLDQVATVGNYTYYHISYNGKDYGWINADGLESTSEYVLPFTYTSQHTPLEAANACEVTSLKMALSVKGIGKDVSLKTFIDNMPRSKNNADEGFVGNPYKVNHTDQDWTINPKPLAQYGRTYYSNVYDITGASKDDLISEIKHGNPLVIAGSYRMQGKATGHMLTVVGYKDGYFLMADPSSRKNSKGYIFWTSVDNFMRIYNDYGKKAVVVR